MKIYLVLFQSLLILHSFIRADWIGDWKVIYSCEEYCLCPPYLSSITIQSGEEGYLILNSSYQTKNSALVNHLNDMTSEIPIEIDKNQKIYDSKSKISFLKYAEIKKSQNPQFTDCAWIEFNQLILGGPKSCPFIMCKMAANHNLFLNNSVDMDQRSIFEIENYFTRDYYSFFNPEVVPFFRKLAFMYETLKMDIKPFNPVPFIPKKIHTIWLGGEIPPLYAFIYRSWQVLHPPEDGWSVKIWGDEEVSNLLEKYPKEFLKKLRTNAMIVDFVRLIILQQDGGVFVELDAFPYRSLNDLVHRYSFFTCYSAWYMQHTLEINVLGVSENHPLPGKIIDWIVQNIEVKTEEFNSYPYREYNRLNNLRFNDWIPPKRGLNHAFAMTTTMFAYTYALYEIADQLENWVVMPPDYFIQNRLEFMPSWAFGYHDPFKTPALRRTIGWNEGNAGVINFDKLSTLEKNLFEEFGFVYGYRSLDMLNFKLKMGIPTILHVFNSTSLGFDSEKTNNYVRKNVERWRKIQSNWEVKYYSDHHTKDDDFCKKLQILQKEGGIIIDAKFIYGLYPLDELNFKLDYFSVIERKELAENRLRLNMNILGSAPNHQIVKVAIEEFCEEKTDLSLEEKKNAYPEIVYRYIEDHSAVVFPSSYFLAEAGDEIVFYEKILTPAFTKFAEYDIDFK